jgi:hypothetical protein
MKNTCLVVIAVVVLGVAREASACSLCGNGFGGGGWTIDPVPGRELRTAMSALTLAGTVAFTTASAFALAEEKLSRRWHVGTIAIALVNLIGAFFYAFVLPEEREPARVPLAIIHAAVGVASLGLPITGLVSVTPTVVGGRDWGGAGVRVAF